MGTFCKTVRKLFYFKEAHSCDYEEISQVNCFELMVCLK